MNEQKTENFRAFAKLYGYIRFFHPSDEAAAMDWDKFAVYGMKYVESANNNEELKLKLEDLYKPIAPSVDIFSGSGEYKYDLSRIIPKDTAGLLPVAWQHRGLGVSRDYLYKSVRSNRIKHPVNSSGSVSRSINAEKYKGKRIRLKASVLSFADEDKNYGLLWLDTTNKAGTSINREKREVRSGEMEEYEIPCEVTEESDKINFGYSLCGEGVALADRFILEVNRGNGWEKIDFDNPDFESDKIGFVPAGWDHTTEDYDFVVISFVQGTGKQSCKIESVYERQLFDKFPEPGEYFVKSISSGLSCAVPLCLYSDKSGTIPHADKNLLKGLNENLNKITPDQLRADNSYINMACIAITWNVLQHSYPYFDLYDLDWEGVLGEYLFRTYNCRDEIEFKQVFDEMTCLINDGHVHWYNRNDPPFFYYPPYAADFAEGEYVVSKLYEENTGLVEGDIILEIDGRKVKDIIAENEPCISAATQGWRNTILLRVLSRKYKDSEITMNIQRDGKILKRTVNWCYQYTQLHKAGDYPEYRPEEIKQIQDGIYYVDLSRAAYSAIEKKLPEITSASGVVFDLRGYPNSNDRILCHLIDTAITSVTWDVPQIIYPDRENLVGYDSGDKWNLEPLKPKIKGKVVFITNGHAISYAESVMEIVEYYNLGKIVGETTAGTNGNVNTINLPGGYAVSYTGMKVLKHDGSRHHGVGIKPDVEVHRTIKGIKEKRDEFLEKAIDIINSN